MTTVDWTRPIEAVHDDGRVVPVKLVSRSRGYEIRPILEDSRGHVAIFQSDGTHPWNRRSERDWQVGWRIRNTPTPERATCSDTATLPPALVGRMVEFVRDIAALKEADGVVLMDVDGLIDARAIVAELPEVVDEDLVEAREIAVELYGTAFDTIKDYRAGRYDTNPEVLNIKAGIARGRQLQREGR